MSTTEPVVFANQTPSGTLIEYSPAPKRWYRVDGAQVPSVTEVLGVLDKPALPWWGMKVGVEGTLQLIREGEIGKLDGSPVLTNGGEYHVALPDTVVALLTQHKLTVNHVRDKAGDRGTSVHNALEVFLETGKMPDPSMYHDEQAGYVQGLCGFLFDCPTMLSIESEVMVGSKSHRFAGRFDLLCLIGETELCTNAKKDIRESFPAGRVLFDLKTSSGVYESHHFQLSAYELASRECGYPETDYQAVVRVTPDGTYEVIRNRSTAEDFLAVKSVYDAIKRFKLGRKKKSD